MPKQHVVETRIKLFLFSEFLYIRGCGEPRGDKGRDLTFQIEHTDDDGRRLWNECARGLMKRAIPKAMESQKDIIPTFNIDTELNVIL